MRPLAVILAERAVLQTRFKRVSDEFDMAARRRDTLKDRLALIGMALQEIDREREEIAQHATP